MSKSCSESFSTYILCLMREAKTLARSCVHAGSSEPSPHADVIRTIISCADQFIVLIFHCEPFILFYYPVSSFEKLKFRNIVTAHISRLVSRLVIQINSRCLFLTMGSKPLQVYRYFHRWINTLCLADFYMEMSMGVSLLRTAQSLLTGRTIVFSKELFEKLILKKSADDK